jgi:hypothetical protein
MSITLMAWQYSRLLHLGWFYWEFLIRPTVFGMVCLLAGLKITYLSKAGRITLIKAILSNLPTYLSFFPILVAVCSCIDKLQWDFLWGGLADEFKFHLVMSQSKVYSTFREGGLGVKNLSLFNRALLEKWFWSYMHERGLVDSCSEF